MTHVYFNVTVFLMSYIFLGIFILFNLNPYYIKIFFYSDLFKVCNTLCVFHSGIRSRGLFWQVGNCFVMLAGRASFPLVGREPSLRHTRLGCAYENDASPFPPTL